MSLIGRSTRFRPWIGSDPHSVFEGASLVINLIFVFLVNLDYFRATPPSSLTLPYTGLSLTLVRLLFHVRFRSAKFLHVSRTPDFFLRLVPVSSTPMTVFYTGRDTCLFQKSFRLPSQDTGGTRVSTLTNR